MTVTVLYLPDEPIAEAWFIRHPGRLAMRVWGGEPDPLGDGHVVAVAFADDTGDVLVLDGARASLIRHTVRAAFSNHSRTVWAHEAMSEAWRMRRAFGLALSSLRCAAVAARVHWPKRNGGYALSALRSEVDATMHPLREVWTERAAVHGCSPPVGESCAWLLEAAKHLSVADCPELVAAIAGEARATAALVTELSSSKYGVAILRQVEVDQEWRWTGFQGIRVDSTVLHSAIGDIESQLRRVARELGAEVWKNTDERRAWLERTGIVPAIDPETGSPSLDRKFRKLAQVPPVMAEVWSRACEAMDVAGSLGKLHEFRKATGGGDRVYPIVSTMTPSATTGRMSVTRPALQNLSNADLSGVGSLRGLLLADEGRVLVGGDLTHVEPSILAALSGDSALIAAVQRGRDPYVEVAGIVWGTKLALEMRKRAKVILLALMYGMGDAQLSTQLRVSQREAAQFRASILGAWPRLAAWIVGVRAAASRGEEIVTIGGRPLPDTRDRPYVSTNYLIQGSAADLFKDMVSGVRAGLPSGARLWLPVHDELVVECLPEDADAVRLLMTEKMSRDVEGVPVWAEPEVLGERWRK